MRLAQEAKFAFTKGETMSEQNPVYTGTSLEKFFEHVGHDVHVVFNVGESLVDKLPNFIKAAEDAEKDVPQIVSLVQAVIKTSIALAQPAISVVGTLVGNGANVIADTTVIPAVEADIPTFKTNLAAFVAAIKELASALGVDWTQLVNDLSIPASTPTTPTTPATT